MSVTNVEKLLFDEVSEIIEYFHPHIVSFNTSQKIDDLLSLIGNAQMRYNPYILLDELQNGADLEEMKILQRTESKRRYQ